VKSPFRWRKQQLLITLKQLKKSISKEFQKQVRQLLISKMAKVRMKSQASEQ
jgi:hypothetical protein